MSRIRKFRIIVILVIYLVGCVNQTNEPTPTVPVYTKPTPIYSTPTKVILPTQALRTPFSVLTEPPVEGRLLFDFRARPPQGGIHIINPDGSDLVQVVTKDELDGGFPKWFPISEKIALVTRKMEGHFISRLVILDLVSDKKAMILPDTEVYNFSISPSDEKLAIAISTSRQFNIATVNSDGTDFQLLVYDGSADYNIQWSPDGMKIAYIGKDNTLFVINRDGSQKIAVAPGIHRNFSWSPNSDKIAFESSGGGSYDIYMANLNEGEVYPIVSSPEIELDPVWSPQGNQIIYESRSKPGWEFELRLLDLDRKENILVADFTQYKNVSIGNSKAVWSPDGNYLAIAVSHDDKPLHIYFYRIDGIETSEMKELLITNDHNFVIDWLDWRIP